MTEARTAPAPRATGDEHDALRERFHARRTVEERVLLECLRRAPAGVRAEVLRAALEDSRFDAVRLLHTAVRHQFAPHLLTQLDAALPQHPAIPAEIRAALHHELVRNWSAKDVLRRTLLAVLDEFAGMGIAVMAVKGTALDLRLDRHASELVSGDVDLILDLEPAQTTEALRARIAALNVGRPVVDVHCRRHPDLVMNGLLSIDFADVWRSASTFDLEGRKLRLMRLEHELLCACIQACRKRYFRLKSLLEIRDLLQEAPAIDWDEVARCARAWRCAPIAYTALISTAAAVPLPYLPPRLDRWLGVGAVHARVLRGLVERLSFSTLLDLKSGWNVRGKCIGRGLILPYASLGVRQWARAGWILGRQLARGSG